MYCKSLTQYNRLNTYEVKVGEVSIGGNNPIVVQTMTSTPTNDIKGTVEQIIRSIDAGAQIVRITVPAMRDVENLKEVKTLLRSLGYSTPLVADIHFNQKIAFEAAKIVEKVRINPGNFGDSKKFNQIDFSNEEYAAELNRVKSEFLPLLEICKEHNTALRIGTNHGSLSDRIMSRFGDTTEGMAESAMEFLRICKETEFKNVVVSMKASNTLIMVQAMRLLVDKMQKEDMYFPLHLGVTEAGEGEDGRIKSAVGIATLLADGIGDTIRVSLTEEPEYEIPVAQKLVNIFNNHFEQGNIPAITEYPIDPYNFKRRNTRQCLNVGANQLPIVIGSEIGNLPPDLHPDFIILRNNSQKLEENRNYLKYLDKTESISLLSSNIYPIVPIEHKEIAEYSAPLFIQTDAKKITDESIENLKGLENRILILTSKNLNNLADQRAAIIRLINNDIRFPVIIKREYKETNIESLQLKSAADCGGLLLDGLCDGLWITNTSNIDDSDVISTAFSILQASRMRVTKPDYISCPSCGRTQFNIQEITKQIRSRTSHLKGLKIGIMGCIVNGLGEMADADYGYIGGAPGKVNLYHHKELIKRGVQENSSVDELINLIKENGDWIEP